MRIAPAGLALVCAGAAAQAPPADDDAVMRLTRPASVVEVGIGHVSDGSFAAGNYNGLDRAGGFAIVNVDVRGAGYSYGNEDDDRVRWRFMGRDLALDARSLRAEYGQQGRYRLTFSHDGIPRKFSDSYRTPFTNPGSSDLVLPPGFTRGADTGALTGLAASLQGFGIETLRRKTEAGYRYAITRDWELAAGARVDTHEGTRVRGLEFGNNGGNPRTLLLPEPVDSVTRQFDLSLSWSDLDSRFSVAWHSAFFDNHIEAIRWQNAFSSTPWTGGNTGLAAGFPLDTGQAGVAPDNRFHQLSFSGSHDFSATTRLTLAATRGLMTQDEPYLPYSINSALLRSALPRASLDGRVDTTFLSARLTLRPQRKLGINASVKFDDRDNRTPQSQYIFIGGDSQLQALAANPNSDRFRTNLPRSRRQWQMVLDADYRISPEDAIRAGLEHEDVKRTHTEVEQARETTARIEFRRGGQEAFTFAVSQAWLARRGTQYLYNLPYVESYSPAFIAALAAANGCSVVLDCVRAGPLQAKFFLADRDRARSRVTAGYHPEAPWSIDARLDANVDRYPHSPYGVTRTAGWSLGADLSYAAGENAGAVLFATIEDQSIRERSRQVAGGISSAAADWQNEIADRTYTVGLGWRQQGLFGGRLDWQADVIALRGRTPITTEVGTGVSAAQNPATALPELRLKSSQLSLGARYAIDRGSALRLAYSYRRLDTADWAYQQLTPATLNNVAGTGETSPRYGVHVVGISYAITFR